MMPLSLITRRADNLPMPSSGTGELAVAAKPRLVGVDTIKQINDIAPGMGRVVQTEGIKSNRMMQLIRSNPGAATAIGVTAALGSAAAYDDILELAQAGIEGVSEVARNILIQTDELEAAAGLNDPTPGEDGSIGALNMKDVRAVAAVVEAGEAIFFRAVAAAGGFNRLMAADEWRAMDPDLRQLIIDKHKGKML